MTAPTAIVHTLPAKAFARAQRRHFIAAVLLPSLATLAAPWLLPSLWPGSAAQAALAAVLLLGMWFVVGGIGVSVGLHRHFSHRSFEATPRLRGLLAVCGQMAAQGPVTYWVALHRMHHAASDQRGDPHSPRASAWDGLGPRHAAWRGHLGWVLSHDVPKPTRYARELIADTQVRRLGRAYPACVAAGIAVPALLAWALVSVADAVGDGYGSPGGFVGSTSGATRLWQAALFGAYWGGVARIALGHHVIWAINSLCHLGAARPHATGDHSSNVGWLALLSWGESWHNNHHAAPTAARFGQGWRQPDIGWWVLRACVALGWARLRSPIVKTEDARGQDIAAASGQPSN